MPQFTRRQCLPVLGALLGASQTASALDQKPETVTAFDRYIADLETRLAPRFDGSRFQWFDDIPSVREQLHKGAVSVRPYKGNGLVQVKSGLIQHWTGAVFVPKATLKVALDIAQDYPHHPDFYKPEIAAAKVRSHQNDEFQVYQRIVKSKLFLSAVFNTEQKVDFHALDAARVWSRTATTRIAEVTDAGKPSEKELPVGKDRGLLWRLTSYRFFEERDGGVYLSSESISLSRDIPFGMGKIATPFIQDLPGEALQMSLDKTRQAMLARL